MTDARTSTAPAPIHTDDGDPLHAAPPEVEAVAIQEPRPRGRFTRREAVRVIGQGLVIFGALAVLYALYVVGVSRFEYERNQQHLLRSIKTSMIAGEAKIGGRIAEGTPVAILTIPRLGLRAAVVEGTSGTLLESGPGHLRNSPLPGQRGVAVIMGRRVAYGGPFRNVDELQRGDKIRTVTGQGRSVYVVTSVKTANDRGTDVVPKRGTDGLTLVTSTPELRAERRLVATATLRTRPFAAPAGRPAEVSKAELGLRGDSSSVLALLVWSELLLLAGCATAFLYRRWGRWNTYLVSTPVLALLVLLVFDSATPILPSTL